MADMTTPYISIAAILVAVNSLLRTDLNEIDIDAMMLQDVSDFSSFDLLDTLVFSFAPTGPIDGGEIFVLSPRTGISFLTHGGVLCDITNDVMGTFGSTVKNINSQQYSYCFKVNMFQSFLGTQPHANESTAIVMQ